MTGSAVKGSGRIRLDDEIVELKPFDLVRVAPGVVRAFEAGPDGLTFIAIGGPRPEEGDGKLVDSPWPEQVCGRHRAARRRTRDVLSAFRRQRHR